MKFENYFKTQKRDNDLFFSLRILHRNIDAEYNENWKKYAEFHVAQENEEFYFEQNGDIWISQYLVYSYLTFLSEADFEQIKILKKWFLGFVKNCKINETADKIISMFYEKINNSDQYRFENEMIKNRKEKIFEFIRSNPEGCTKTEICKKYCYIPKNDRNGILLDLEESGKIENQKERVGSNVVKTIYKAVL